MVAFYPPLKPPSNLTRDLLVVLNQMRGRAQCVDTSTFFFLGWRWILLGFFLDEILNWFRLVPNKYQYKHQRRGRFTCTSPPPPPPFFFHGIWMVVSKNSPGMGKWWFFFQIIFLHEQWVTWDICGGGVLMEWHYHIYQFSICSLKLRNTWM